MSILPPIKYVLMDIEGTTTSVSFVYDTLFPYFLKNLSAFIEQHPGADFLEKIYEQVRQEAEAPQLSPPEIIELLHDWVAKDYKRTSLKTLQGYVWKDGYEKGEIKGHLYEDVLPILKKWQAQSILMGIYSSGSVAAQRLLFGTSIYGDLNPYFSHNFDTHIGSKKESNSYINIQKELAILAHHILFLSDVEAELDAAQVAGFQTLQLVREGTQASQKHPTVSDFSEIPDLV